MTKKINTEQLISENEKLKGQLKKTSQERSKVNSHLQRLYRQRDEFISMAAHELRGPMTAIKGYLSMIIQGDAGEIPEKAEGFIIDASAISDRIIRLINNMLNVSRIEEGRTTYQMKRVSLSKAARYVFEQSRFEAERKGLTVSLEKQDDLNDFVFVDPDRLFEVIDNLFSNAVKYTNKGSVVIRLLQPNKKTVRLEVVDSGPGISQDEQKRIFRKFYRVKSAVGKTIGTGLGLYISKLLVERFDGVIGVISGIGKGATFWFELPVERRGVKGQGQISASDE